MTQTLTKRASAMDNIDAMLKRVANAQEKGAEANTEAGGFQGETTHPVKDVDDRTDDAQEGARSAENTSDVKDDQGSPAVDATAPGTPGGQDSAQLNIGTNQSATGEDSTVETESAKGGKDDPGTQRGQTAHPARTDNDALDGHKYAQAKSVLDKVAAAEASGNAFLADLATDANAEVQAKAAALQSKQAEPTTAGDPSGASATPDSEPEAAHSPGKGGGGASRSESDDKEAAKEAAEAGYDLAAAVAAGGMVEGAQKEAQDQMIFTALEDTVQESFDRAEKTAAYVHAFNAEKKAMAEEGEHEEPSGDEGGEPANPPEAAGDEGGETSSEAPAEGAPMGGEGGGGEEAALLEALTQGGDIGGEQALEGMGGGEGGAMPPEAGMPPEGGGMPGAMPGAMPEGGMPPEGGGLAGLLGGQAGPAEGGMPPEAGMPPEGGMEGGMGLEGLTEEDLAMLLAALQQQGIAPEQFEAKAAEKAAKALSQKLASGESLTEWKPKTAAQAQQLQRLVNYVKEVAGT